MSHSSSSTRAEPKILKKSWRLRSDQDGGSGGHLLGQRWMQVREKATGDLLVFIFVKIPLQLSLFFVKVKVFWSLSLSLSYNMCTSWKGSEGIESTRKMWLVSNSEIKAEKEQVDHKTLLDRFVKLLHLFQTLCSTKQSWSLTKILKLNEDSASVTFSNTEFEIKNHF